MSYYLKSWKAEWGEEKRQESMWSPRGCAQARDVQMGWVWVADS